MRSRILTLLCVAPLALHAQSQPPTAKASAVSTQRKAERDAVIASLDAMEKEIDEAEYRGGIDGALAQADAKASNLARVQSWSGGNYYAASPTSGSTSRGSALGFTGHEQTDASGLIYMQNRFYIPAYGRFLTPDRTMPYKLENPQTLNMYAYTLNNPILYTDPDGNDITITGHQVGGIGPYHTAVRFTPNNQGLYKNNPNFRNIDSRGNHYTTLSAGPSLGLGGKLVSEINKATDLGPQKYESGALPMPGGKSEDQVFGNLMRNFNNYNNDLDYSLFPTGQVPMFDSNFNSNSFTDGLLQSVGFPEFALPITAPGWKDPVPLDQLIPPPPPPPPEMTALPQPQEKK